MTTAREPLAQGEWDGQMYAEVSYLQPSLEGGWDTVASVLGRKLRLVEEAGPAWYVVLSVVDDRLNLFSQACVQRGEPVFSEVVSDRFLAGRGGPLSYEQRAALAAAGWTDPVVPDEGQSWPNWYRYIDGPARWEETASAMVFALEAILGVQATQQLGLDIFQGASGDEDEEDPDGGRHLAVKSWRTPRCPGTRHQHRFRPLSWPQRCGSS